MHEVKLNLPRNAVFCRTVGKVDPDEAREYVASYKKALDQLSPGFTVISDMRNTQPAAAETSKIMAEMVTYSAERGIGCGVRILAENMDSQIGSMQLDRISRDLGYKVLVVTSYDEAKEVLGWT